MWLEEEEEKHTPRPQIRSHGRKLFILDIATVNPLLARRYEFYFREAKQYFTNERSE